MACSTSAFREPRKAISSNARSLTWQENDELLLFDDFARPTLLILSPPPPSPPLAQIIPEGERFFFTSSSSEKLDRNELDERCITDAQPLISSRARQVISNTIRFTLHPLGLELIAHYNAIYLKARCRGALPQKVESHQRQLVDNSDPA